MPALRHLILEKLERAESIKSCIQIKTNDEDPFLFFPHRLLVMDRELSVIGEKCEDRSLCLIHLKSIKAVRICSTRRSYSPLFSGSDVDQFVLQFREVVASEERLLLKIRPGKNIDFSLPFQYLGSPMISSSTRGEMIWEASIERSPELYRWLLSVEENVEILSTKKIIEGFEEFKKAS